MALNHVIDPNIDHYQTFFDTEWATQLIETVDGTKLEPHVFNLCESWKGLGNVFRMQWLLIHSMKNFAEGELQEMPLAGYAKKMADHFSDVLLSKLPGFGPTKSNRIRQALNETSNEFRVRASKAHEEARKSYQFPGQQLWEQWCGESEFRFALVATQRVCYGGLFYGYESYLKEAMSLMTKTDFWIGYKTLCKDMTPFVGQAVAEKCTDLTVRAAREVRNAFAHNGGKRDSQLTATEKEFAQLGLDFPVQIVGDEIHIIAEDTQRLAVELKERVTLLTDAVLKFVSANP